ncbi:MAG TPA: hypothetical protein ENJ32_11090, partial [Crenotrichaceae bacterium]|nr:hypothetical protein [Crenotrichaceae bacterium]
MTLDNLPSKKSFPPLLWIFTCCLLFVSLTVRADIGVDWLVSQTQGNGSYSSQDDIATSFQATSETLTTLYALGETTQPGIPSAHQFINNETYQGTEYLSRQIISNIQQGNAVTDLVSTLLGYQNLDGGFGELPGYNSTTLDTIFAAQALALAGQTSTQAAGFAIAFLQSHQHQTGDFSLAGNDASIYITALASQTLQAYQYTYALTDNITRANNYLLSQINADGSIGELFETAVTLTALAPTIADQALYQPLADHLQAAKLANGSWENDVYTTALALKAIHTQQTVTPPQPDLSSLSGVVKDGASNQPLNGVNVVVTLSDGQALSATTNSEGRYLISNIPPGSASAQFSINTYFSATANVTLIAGQVLSYDVSLLSDPAANPIQLSGQIVDIDTAMPVSGASIQILTSSFSTQSDINGDFEILDISAGSITVKITKGGYLSQLLSISAPAGGIVDLGVINLNPGTVTGTESSISGVITDAATGDPLRGVLISVTGSDNLSTFTTQDGQYTITNIQPGTIVVSASLDGYQIATGTAELVAGTNLLFNAALVKNSNPALVPLQGQVIDAGTQLALAGVSISA